MWRLVLLVALVAFELCLQLIVDEAEHQCDEAAGVCRLEYPEGY